MVVAGPQYPSVKAQCYNSCSAAILRTRFERPDGAVLCARFLGLVCLLNLTRRRRTTHREHRQKNGAFRYRGFAEARASAYVPLGHSSDAEGLCGHALDASGHWRVATRAPHRAGGNPETRVNMRVMWLWSQNPAACDASASDQCRTDRAPHVIRAVASYGSGSTGAEGRPELPRERPSGRGLWPAPSSAAEWGVPGSGVRQRAGRSFIRPSCGRICYWLLIGPHGREIAAMTLANSHAQQ